MAWHFGGVERKGCILARPSRYGNGWKSGKDSISGVANVCELALREIVEAHLIAGELKSMFFGETSTHANECCDLVGEFGCGVQVAPHLLGEIHEEPAALLPRSKVPAVPPWALCEPLLEH